MEENSNAKCAWLAHYRFHLRSAVICIEIFSQREITCNYTERLPWNTQLPFSCRLLPSWGVAADSNDVPVVGLSSRHCPCTRLAPSLGPALSFHYNYALYTSLEQQNSHSQQLTTRWTGHLMNSRSGNCRSGDTGDWQLKCQMAQMVANCHRLLSINKWRGCLSALEISGFLVTAITRQGRRSQDSNWEYSSRGWKVITLIRSRYLLGRISQRQDGTKCVLVVFLSRFSGARLFINFLMGLQSYWRMRLVIRMGTKIPELDDYRT